MHVFILLMLFFSSVCHQWLLLYLCTCSLLSSAYRKPRRRSSPTSTHLMMLSQASLPQKRRFPPPKRSTHLLQRFHPWLHLRPTQKRPSPRTRPISCMRGQALSLATPPASCLVRNWKIYNRLITVQMTELFCCPTFHQKSRSTAAAPPLFSSPHQKLQSCLTDTLAKGGGGDLMDSQQLPLSPEHCMKKTLGGRSCRKNCREKKTCKARDIPEGHLLAALIVRTFVLH